ncbi:hypothetical protein Tsp_03476 [Trichinella spiralis]|uniref:hypothetical protein n=1 Tax=Trichinella spiralis TaxID=6334 RepID=UPI0001EFB220|nr:hypothetical protein Tsp_03476 [Trichinella spiralis]
MISSAFQLGQRVCDLISENLTPTITATATVSAIDDANASSNFIVKYSQKSATFKRQIDMIKRFNSSSSSSSTSMLSGSEFGSCSTTWNCQKPRRWAPVQFSPLTTPVRRYVQQEQNGLQFAYDTVQSLPVTPVPPSSPTFSEPTHSSCTNNYETSDDILEHFNQLQDVACFNSQLRKASSSSSQYAKPRLVNSSSNFSSGVRRCDKFGVSLEAIREGIELRDCSTYCANCCISKFLIDVNEKILCANRDGNLISKIKLSDASTCSHEDFSFTKSSGPSHALPLLHHGKEQSAFENEKIINHKLHAVGEMGCCQSCSLLTVSKRDSTETRSSSNSDGMLHNLSNIVVSCHCNA